MSKEFVFDISEWQGKEIFKVVRDKKDILTILFNTIKYIKYRDEIDAKKKIGTITLKVSKMSRFFFFSDDRNFSINCPFTVREEEDGVVGFYSSVLGKEIDSVDISNVLSLFNGIKVIDETCVLEFADKISNMSGAQVHYWNFVKSILLIETGYLRYDHDPDRENGNLHPLKHLDVFYSTGVTFKIGLEDTVESNCIEDILDIETDCHFLAKKVDVVAVEEAIEMDEKNTNPIKNEE